MKRNSSGFTILELLIAISLAVMILLILFAGMRLASRSQQKASARSELNQRMRIVGDRVSWLIRGAYPYIVQKPDEKKLYFSGEDDALGLVTTAVDTAGRGPEDRAGLKWAYFFVDSKGLQVREKVYFLEDVFENSGGMVTLIDPDVRKITFSYLDVNEDDQEGSWTDSWNPTEKDYLPAAVKVGITFRQEETKAAMPEMIVTIQARSREFRQ